MWRSLRRCFNSWRSLGAAPLSAAAASSGLPSSASTLTWMRALRMSGEHSTEVSVTPLTRGSRSSSRISSESSRWICELMRAVRGYSFGMGARRLPRGDGLGLDRALDLDALEALDLVAGLDVVVVLHADAALGAGLDLAGVVL